MPIEKKIKLNIAILIGCLGLLGLFRIIEPISLYDFYPGSLFVYGIDKNHYFDDNPSFSPDGSRIILESLRYWVDDTEIYEIDLDGSNRVRLTFHRGYDWCPSYSPDSKKILYVSEENGKWGIYTMNTDGRNKHQVTSEFVTCSDKNWYLAPTRPSYSPDGRKIAFWMNWNIYTMNADGSDIRKLTNFDGTDFYRVSFPRFSPDGSRIVFSIGILTCSDESGRKVYVRDKIYTMNSDGSELSYFESTSGFEKDPAYSPDGKNIVFCSHDETAISIMDSDGGNIRRLTHDDLRDCSSPCYSLDGSQIAFSAHLGYDEVIYLMDADGGNLKPISKLISKYAGIFNKVLRPILVVISLLLIILIGQIFLARKKA